MYRAEVIELINKKLFKQYGYTSKTRICDLEGWNLTELSRALNSKDDTTIPKTFQRYAGVEFHLNTVEGKVYKRSKGK